MRLYVDVGEGRFVYYEQMTEEYRGPVCPTCGHRRSGLRTVDKRMVLVEGDRQAPESSWHVVKEQHLDDLPYSFEAGQKAAKEFAACAS